MPHAKPEDLPEPRDLMLLAALLRGSAMTEAAREAGLSLSSAARRLAALREKTGDKLFTRSGNRLVATPSMKILAEKLHPLLNSLGDFYSARVFRPETLKGTLRIMTTDNNFLNFVAPVLPRITREAPDVAVEIQPLRRNGAWLIESGRADLGIYAFPAMKKGIKAMELGEDEYCLVTKKNHPLAAKYRRTGEVTLHDATPYPQYMNRRFAKTVNDPCGYEKGPGRKRIYTPYFNSIPEAILASDAVQWSTVRAAKRYADPERFCVMRASSIPDYGGPGIVKSLLVWAEREDLNPGSQWVRSLIVAAARDLPPLESL